LVKIGKLKNQIESTKADIDRIKKEIEDLTIKIKIIDDSKLIESNSILNEIADVKNCLDNIYCYFEKNKVDKDFKKFIYLYNKSIESLNTFDEYTQTLKGNEEKYKAKQTMESKLSKIENSISRCNVALDSFENLEKSDDILAKFVKENAQYIEKTFKAIHQPKEFKDINITDGIITFKRNSGDGLIVKENEMSTGQCIALYTAVLLTLFNVSQNAPNIIIFDEPVANLDDLHLLSLIDIIREYVLNGIQVIFTTANPDIEKIFRRKFSFLKEEFRKIEFARFDCNKTKIKSCTFLPNKEECILLDN